MSHNVYARIEVHVTDDGATWLATDIEARLLADVNPSDLEVEALTIMEGDDAGAIDNREAVEINFTSDLDARSITARVEDILNSYFPEDVHVDVD